MANSAETTVDDIAKRDAIFAWSKDGETYIEASGYGITDDGGVYCGIMERNRKSVRGREDVVLKPDEWDIYVLVKYQAKR